MLKLKLMMRKMKSIMMEVRKVASDTEYVEMNISRDLSV